MSSTSLMLCCFQSFHYTVPSQLCCIKFLSSADFSRKLAREIHQTFKLTFTFNFTSMYESLELCNARWSNPTSMHRIIVTLKRGDYIGFVLCQRKIKPILLNSANWKHLQSQNFAKLARISVVILWIKYTAYENAKLILKNYIFLTRI